MVKTTLNQLAKKLPLDIAEDAKVGGNSDDGDDAMVKRLPLSKKPNVPTGYFISLHSK